MLLFFYQSESSNLSNVKNIGVSAQATFPYLQRTDINTKSNKTNALGFVFFFIKCNFISSKE